MTQTASAETSVRLAAGQGHLEVKNVAGQSAATSVWATSPLKIFVPRPRGACVWACMSSLGGGMVAGDQVNLRVNLEPKTRCFLTTQASTKIYRNPDAAPCGHNLVATLGCGSFLALIPDPVQAFAGSYYSQKQIFNLDSGSNLALVDWVCAGRVANGERWAFSLFQSRNEVFVDTRRVCLDSLLMDSSDGPLDRRPGMNRFNCLALVLILGDSLQTVCRQNQEEVAEEPVVRDAPLISSASPVQHGTLLRIAGEHVEQVGARIRHHLSFLHTLLGDDPWARKW